MLTPGQCCSHCCHTGLGFLGWYCCVCVKDRRQISPYFSHDLIPNTVEWNCPLTAYKFSKVDERLWRSGQPDLNNGAMELSEQWIYWWLFNQVVLWFLFCSLHSLGSCSVTHQVPAHVLKDLLTVIVLVSTRVLIGPFDREDWTFIVVETSHIVASAIVVLGIIQSGWKWYNTNKFQCHNVTGHGSNGL